MSNEVTEIKINGQIIIIADTLHKCLQAMKKHKDMQIKSPPTKDENNGKWKVKLTYEKTN